MNNRIHLSLLTSYLLLLTSSAAVQQKWTCETSRVEPVYFNAYHGETLKLDAKLLSNGRPVTNVTTASFLWQTNGMGSAWWQTNATFAAGHVKATFTPAMDPGASAVTFFFQVTDQDGSNYRPAGKLYLVKALGDNPVFPDIPPPGGTIDFSLLTLVNAPWATLEAAQSAVSTGVNEALNAVANESNRAERTYAKLSDIPSVPSISGLATTGEVAAAKAEAQAAAEATAAATYQPLAGMAEYAKLSDIPSVPSIAGLATTGQVVAAKAEAQAAAESTAAATYQPLSGMADYAKLTDIPQVPSIAGLATTGEVAAAKAEAQAAAEQTAAATYQPLSAMIDYAQKHEVPEVTISNRTISVNGNYIAVPLPGESGRVISDGTNAIDAAGNVYLNGVLTNRVALASEIGQGVDTNAVRDIALLPATNYTDRATGEVFRSVGALADTKRDKTNLTVKVTVGWTDNWSPNNTGVPPNPSDLDYYYGDIVWSYGYNENTNVCWRCYYYVWYDEFRSWESIDMPEMGGEFDNRNAIMLTFPDGVTKAYRDPITRDDTLALVSQLQPPGAYSTVSNAAVNSIQHIVDTNANLIFTITGEGRRFYFTPIRAINPED